MLGCGQLDLQLPVLLNGAFDQTNKLIFRCDARAAFILSSNLGSLDSSKWNSRDVSQSIYWLCALGSVSSAGRMLDAFEKLTPGEQNWPAAWLAGIIQLDKTPRGRKFLTKCLGGAYGDFALESAVMALSIDSSMEARNLIRATLLEAGEARGLILRRALSRIHDREIGTAANDNRLVSSFQIIYPNIDKRSIIPVSQEFNGQRSKWFAIYDLLAPGNPRYRVVYKKQDEGWGIEIVQFVMIH